MASIAKTFVEMHKLLIPVKLNAMMEITRMEMDVPQSVKLKLTMSVTSTFVGKQFNLGVR